MVANFQHIYKPDRNVQRKVNGDERVSGRNPIRRNFGGRGGRGFNKNKMMVG